MASDVFILDQDREWEELGDGVSRKILGFDNQIMMVKVMFDTGAIGAAHQHFHAQTTYCTSGKFEFVVNGKAQIIQPGDALYVAPNVMHGARCIESGELLDVFSPAREDFLDGSTVSYLGK